MDKPTETAIKAAVGHFQALLGDQFDRIERLRSEAERLDFTTIRPLRVGFVGGDGIGPIIAAETRRVLERLLKEDIERGAVVQLPCAQQQCGRHVIERPARPIQ